MSDSLSTDLVVVDVDNTLFDWVSLWGGAFETMIQSLVDRTGIAAHEWIARARNVHVRRGVIECPSLLEDLATAADWPDHVDRAAVILHAVGVYRRYWDVHLAPYAGVRDTLTALALRGVPVVAYTESDASIAATRLTRLGLAGVIRTVFGRATRHVPERRDWALIPFAARSPIAIDVIPHADSKPNPLGLRTILARCGVDAAHAVHVGDDLWNDVAMAQRLGVRALWAAYGTTPHPRLAALVESVALECAADRPAADAATIDRVRPDARLARPAQMLDAVSPSLIPLAV